jgi:hypothetical protein
MLSLVLIHLKDLPTVKDCVNHVSQLRPEDLLSMPRSWSWEEDVAKDGMVFLHFCMVARGEGPGLPSP